MNNMQESCLMMAVARLRFKNWRQVSSTDASQTRPVAHMVSVTLQMLCHAALSLQTTFECKQLLKANSDDSNVD